ncbi:unnamed protein product [Moneuplotes crassus]|uniref:BZIP domain-containing protein n=1 Tax=Euplotes crassus TaxID=5936 RepID=A0AAD1UIF9_EUPCR|nr:unnamed protein product [Moneuplotes crassus]
MISNQSSTYDGSGETSLSDKISELFQNETGTFEGNTNEESTPLAFSEGEPLLKKSTPEEPPKKRKRRRKAHRLSNSERAKKAREKKKLYYNDLENKVASLTELCEALKRENTEMKSKLSQLQKTETTEKPCYDTQKKRDSKSYDKALETLSKQTGGLAASGRTQSESNLRIGTKDIEKDNGLEFKQNSNEGVKITHLSCSDVNRLNAQVCPEDKDIILYQNQNIDDQMFKSERADEDMDNMAFKFDRECIPQNLFEHEAAPRFCFEEDPMDLIFKNQGIMPDQNLVHQNLKLLIPMR